MQRDMTADQFKAACERHGFVRSGFLGYYRLASDPNVSVSVHNAGPRRRDQLAYLIAADKKHQRSAARPAEAAADGQG